jgi:UDP-3-O-acyl-N-acetylglucosamine deacetylase
MREAADLASVVLIGKGLHTGQSSQLSFRLADKQDNHGVAFSEPSFFSPAFPQSLTMQDISVLPRSNARSTVLGNGSMAIRTPEHLWAALLFFHDLPVKINCDTSEIPGLDGSALPFRQALSSLSPTHALRPAWREYSTDLQWEYDWGYGHMRVRPATSFCVRYILERGPVVQSFVLRDPSVAWAEILPARTFVFYREWEIGKAQGLMAGAGLDSGLLLAESQEEHAQFLSMHSDWSGGPFPLLNQPQWRMDNELVKHKILDLLGDLALAGLALPKLDIEIRNGGHSINHLLLEKLSMN